MYTIGSYILKNRVDWATNLIQHILVFAYPYLILIVGTTLFSWLHTHKEFLLNLYHRRLYFHQKLLLLLLHKPIPRQKPYLWYLYDKMSWRQGLKAHLLCDQHYKLLPYYRPAWYHCLHLCVASIGIRLDWFSCPMPLKFHH